MTLSPDSVAAYKTLMTNPKESGLNFPSLSEVFEETEDATAKHLIYEQYLNKIEKSEAQMPKIFFYVVMDEIYKQKKAADGNSGYCVRVRE